MIGALIVSSPWLLSAATAKVKKFTSNNPTAVTISLISPAVGSTVSGNVQVQVTASSTAAPIKRVEFYMDGKLFAIVNSNNVPIPIPPTTFNAK